MAKRKIVLFSANTRYIGPPLGLLSITKLLDTDKYDIKIITRNEYDNYEEEVVKQCEGALCLGISVISGFPVKVAKKVSQMVKEKYPDLPIMWGGWQTTTLPEITLDAPYVDYVCMGQGERTFKEFVDLVETGNLNKPAGVPTLSKIKHLGYKRDGKIILNERTGTEDLESLPDFNMDLINWEKFFEVTDFGKRVLRITTSYGCPYRCAFCCEPYNSKRIWKTESAGKVINYIKELRKRANFDGLMIVDSNFFVNEQRVSDICKGIIENNFNIKIGQVNGRTNNLVKYKPETWELLKKAGLYNILIGAESGNPETLDFINKDATVEDTLKLVDICSKYGIFLVASVIVGLPTANYFRDSNTAFQEDLDGILTLYDKISKNGSNHHLLTFPYAPLPFSPLYDKAVELGFVPPTDIDTWSDYEFTTVHVPWISKAGFNKILVLNYISVVMSVDFKYLFESVPKYLEVLIVPVISSLKFISKLRFRTKFLSFAVDMWLFNMGMLAFVIINKKLKLVGLAHR